MVESASGIVGLLQVVGGLLKLSTSIQTTSDTALRNAQLLEFQHALIGLNSLVATVQQENTSLLNQKNDAEAALKRMENWGDEKRRYKLASPFVGATVFALQRSMSQGEPPHYLCTACFANRKGSIMQGREGKVRKEGGYMNGLYSCPVCKTEAESEYMNVPAAQYFEDIPPPK